MSDRIHRTPAGFSSERPGPLTVMNRPELHLFSMSTHTSHPSAKSSAISLGEHCCWSTSKFITMEIAGDYIAVLLPHDNSLHDLPPQPGTFLLVDWKTGIKHVSCSLVCAQPLLTIRGSHTRCPSHGAQTWKDLYSYGKTL